jgi:VWFA-related protein
MTFLITTLLILVSVAGAQDIADAPTFRTGVSDVKVDAQVVENGKIISGLTQDAFQITDEGQPRKIVYFGRDAEPLSLVLLLDISGSMHRWLQRIASTAREAMGYLRPGDKVAIMVFGKTVAIHQGFSDNLEETTRQIASAITDHDVGAGTAINQSVAVAAEYMRKNAGSQGRHAILILTDNLSISYQFRDEEVIKALYAGDTVLNAIVVGRAIRPGPPKEGVYQNPDFTPADVFKLTEETGGEAVRADETDISFKDMIERIRTRYSLSYHAPAGAPGTFRHVGVTLTGDAKRRYPLAEVRARHGYYVSEQ